MQAARDIQMRATRAFYYFFARLIFILIVMWGPWLASCASIVAPALHRTGRADGPTPPHSACPLPASTSPQERLPRLPRGAPAPAAASSLLTTPARATTAAAMRELQCNSR
jgi:hypothetical protein